MLIKYLSHFASVPRSTEIYVEDYAVDEEDQGDCEDYC